MSVGHPWPALEHAVCKWRSNPYLENVTALPLLRHVFTLEEEYPCLVGEGHAVTPVTADPDAEIAKENRMERLP